MLNPLRDSSLLSLGANTSGAVHLDACAAAGMSEAKVRWQVDAGRWQYVFPRVLATFSGPVPYLTLQHAAVLYGGAGAALSHATAGADYRLCRPPPELQITVPYEREVVDQPGLEVHRSRTLTDAAVSSSQPRRTTIERTVLDLLNSKRSADAALGLVGEAIRSRRTTADRLRCALLASPCTRWRKVVLDAMPDLTRGAESPLEVKDARLRRRHGLPQGRRQVRRLSDGTEYLDVFIEEWQIHVELDGRLGHDSTREQWRDMRRDNRSEVRQVRHLRYGWADVVDRPCAVAIEQAVVLRQQGWQGKFKRCPDCPPVLPPEL